MNKKGLGKGLGALIPKGSVFTGGRTIVNISIDQVIPNPRQPRTIFNESSLKELADSIKTSGVAQPVLVRMRKGNYELVAGERRLRAAKLAGLAAIPAIIKDFSDEESVQLALIENLQREDLNPMDEAEAYGRLVSEFNLSQEVVAKKVSKNRSTVANMLRLLELPKDVQKALRKGDLSTGHARALLSIENKDKQLSIFHEVVKSKLSVRDIEVLVYGAPKSIKARKASNSHKKANDELKPWEDKLTTHLATKVRMHGTASRGRIEVEYFSQDDLERILTIITGEALENTHKTAEKYELAATIPPEAAGS
ncbi:ParB/RepB/Spo0J family partition protein [Candidatus Saganbacteria bacterium]|nr:ParB/RepB/Spo0J family partition protein [Candidatus Saganbacteria bacterium]